MKITPKICNTHPQYGRSLLSLWAAVTPCIFERRVQKRYTSEKMPSQCPQNGRSMIEMLGVLAIIGVLSVGGIMGYSKAMAKYRVNKAIEQITTVLANYRSFCKSNKECYEHMTNTVARKAHLYPEEMLNKNNDQAHHVWDDYFAAENSSIYMEFNASTITAEECIMLLTHDWRNASINKIEWSYCNDEDGCTNLMPAPFIPVNIEDATIPCQDAENGNFEQVKFSFEL